MNNELSTKTYVFSLEIGQLCSVITKVSLGERNVKLCDKFCFCITLSSNLDFVILSHWLGYYVVCYILKVIVFY